MLMCREVQNYASKVHKKRKKRKTKKVRLYIPSYNYNSDSKMRTVSLKD